VASGDRASGMSGSTPSAKSATIEAVATSAPTHESAAIIVARRGEETRVLGEKAARASVRAPSTAPPTEAQTLKFRAPSAGTECGTAEKTRLDVAIRKSAQASMRSSRRLRSRKRP